MQTRHHASNIMEETNLEVFETTPALGNGNRNGDVQHSTPRSQSRRKQWKIVAGLLGVALMIACVIIVVLVLVLGKTSSCDDIGEITIRTAQPRKGVDLLNFTSCGTYMADRILNGQQAKLSQYPWMALLMNSAGEIICGGTLISSQYVLTAAHCVDHVKTIRLGEHDITTEPDCEDVDKEDCALPVQNFTVKRSDIIQHPYYSPSKRSNDIALIRLSKPADMTDDRVLPICLPYEEFDNTNHTQADSKMTITGWGLTENGTTSNVLMYASVKLKPIRACNSAFLKIKSKIVVDDRNLCAAGNDQENHCVGDSGGPLQKALYVGERTVVVQYGIITFGEKGCTLNNDTLPGAFIRVNSYIDWILNKLIE